MPTTEAREAVYSKPVQSWKAALAEVHLLRSFRARFWHVLALDVIV